MKILFTDVDGVLNHKDSFWKEENRYSIPHVLDSECLDQLERIVKETGAKVVLSSTWRLNLLSRTIVSTVLAERGIILYDSTPDLETTERWREIEDYMSYAYHDGCRYAVLDDDVDADPWDGSFFQTSWEDGGLTEEIANKVIEYLNKED